MTVEEAIAYLKSCYFNDSKLREAVRIVVAKAEDAPAITDEVVEKKTRRKSKFDEE